MITQGEIFFIKELIVELSALADPSEYIEGEVQEAIDLLDKLSRYNLEQVMQMVEVFNNQLSEIENNV
jgi:hypothetical protein